MTGAFSYLCIFLSSLTFPWLSNDNALGISGTFLLYSISAAAAAAFALLSLPKPQLSNQDLVIRGRNPANADDRFTDISGEDSSRISAFKMSYSDSGGDLVVDRETGPADATDVVFVAVGGGGNSDNNDILEYIKPGGAE